MGSYLDSGIPHCLLTGLIFNVVFFLPDTPALTLRMFVYECPFDADPINVYDLCMIKAL